MEKDIDNRVIIGYRPRDKGQKKHGKERNRNWMDNMEYEQQTGNLPILKSNRKRKVTH